MSTEVPSRKTENQKKKRRPSMQAIADRCGVSKVTVYKALRTHSGVSEHMRQQILRTAEEMGYNYPAPQRSYQIAFLVPQRFFLESDAFYTNIYYVMYQFCVNNNHQLPLFILDYEYEVEGVLPPQMVAQRFDGIVVAGEMHPALLNKIATLGAPTIYVDFSDPSFANDCVLVDNYFAAFQLTEFLISLGHKRIGFMGEIDSYANTMDRYFGFRKALRCHDLEFRSDWIIHNLDHATGLYRLDFPLPDPLPTAFVCHCDMAAYYLIEAMNRQNIKCPQDVSVVSFDNTRLASSIIPRLSSVDISTKAMAMRSIERLLSHIADPSLPAERLYINTHLVERDSVLPPTR